MYSSNSNVGHSSGNSAEYQTEITDESECDDSPLISGAGTPPEDGKFPKARQILGLMGFLGFANVYAMRVNLSVAIVAMVNHTAFPSQNVNISDECKEYNNGTIPTSTDGPFMWDETTQGIVLGSFFYGYVLTQIPGGRLAEIYGGKRIYGFGVLITAIFTILTPYAASSSMTALIIVRVIEGMGEGVTFPSMHAMLARWVPPLERSKFAAVVYAGCSFGTVISLPLSGWLCSLTFYGGWPLAFYIFGVIGIVWFIFWVLFVYDTPQQHPFISGRELQYIEHSTRQKQDVVPLSGANESVPWGSIFTSVPLWAILITQCGQSWTFYTLLTELPSYMDRILHVNIQQNAILSALPYLSTWVCSIFISFFADWLLAKRCLSQKNSYKLWNSVAALGPALGLMGVTWAGCDKIWVIIMLAFAGGSYGAVYSGNSMNHIALSPKYAGTMMGITNAAANTCGFLAPYVIGVLVNGNETMTQWRFIFVMGAAINISCNFFYLIFASAEEQPWSRNSRSNT